MRWNWFFVFLIVVQFCAANALLAQAGSPGLAGFKTLDRGPLVQISAPADGGSAQGASLFRGRATTGFFAPARKRVSETPKAPVAAEHPALQGSDVERIRTIISRAESRRDGYDAVQHGAKRRPPKRPTAMTIAEIFAWIKATPGQPHAIGRYQFIPATLRRVVREAGVNPKAKFSPQIQDRLADVLLKDAGLQLLRAGKINRRTFMNNLAKIWAGLPNQTGKSHYHGYAGNKASVTWAYFEREMRKIFPS